MYGDRPSAWGTSASAVEEAHGSLFHHWQAFAVGSAFFAALTAIFGKIGVSEINSDLATLIRTVVIIALEVNVEHVAGPRVASLAGQDDRATSNPETLRGNILLRESVGLLGPEDRRTEWTDVPVRRTAKGRGEGFSRAIEKPAS